MSIKKSGLANNPLFALKQQKEEPPTTTSEGESVAENPKPRTGERVNGRTGERPNERTVERVNARTSERPIIRRSYQVYADQHEALLRLEYESNLSGKPRFISDFVREALDYVIKKNK